MATFFSSLMLLVFYIALYELRNFASQLASNGSMQPMSAAAIAGAATGCPAMGLEA